MKTQSNWQVLFLEAAGLAGFVVGAGALAILLEHPDSIVMSTSWAKNGMVRRIPLGVVMGVYIYMVVSLFGKKSGAHINPSVTWTFYRLGKISWTDAILYTIAQFTGAILASQLLKYTFGSFFAHPKINYGISEPQPPYGATTAFFAEYIISFILMLVVLWASSAKKLEKYVALLSGLLIALYLVIELPFSGMSLNPARSTASALAGNQWRHLWIYFVAPTIAMLTAAEVFLALRKRRLTNNTGAVKEKGKNYQELPTFPILD